ncbi:MAG: sirohydrochlorin cobaltochelatase [Tissierellia bacterium]|nr:sirohydrochlorin cobaltochelatase [Tissierellia bacterium]
MEKAIIVASFGTTHKDTRIKCIDPIVEMIRERFPDYMVVEAITSRIVRRRIENNEGLKLFNEIEAKDYLMSLGIKEIYVQPLHIISGHEYEKLKKLDLITGKPLMYDYDSVVELAEVLKSYNEKKTAFIGHGTDHEADELYDMLERELSDNQIVTTIEGSKSFDHLLDNLNAGEEILLSPLMLVAGDHAKNDIAGEEDSWSSMLKERGYKVEVDLRGLGEIQEIREIFLKRVDELVNKNRRKLYIIGTGPGASDLMTMRAINAIKESNIIFAPENKGRNMALDTASKYINNSEIVEIPLPMKDVVDEDYIRAADIIMENLGNKTGAYLTIGDAMTYSTAIYIMERLPKDLDIEIIPGITSYIYSFDKLAVPMAIKGDSFLLIDRLNKSNADILDEVNSVAILKASMNPEETIKILEDKGFEYNLVKRASLEKQEIIDDRDEIISNRDYMSLIVARKERG